MVMGSLTRHDHEAWKWFHQSMIRSTSTLKRLPVPSLRVFLIGLCTALTACVATPQSRSLAIALPEAQQTLELNAVFGQIKFNTAATPGRDINKHSPFGSKTYPPIKCLN